MTVHRSRHSPERPCQRRSAHVRAARPSPPPRSWRPPSPPRITAPPPARPAATNLFLLLRTRPARPFHMSRGWRHAARGLSRLASLTECPECPQLFAPACGQCSSTVWTDHTSFPRPSAAILLFLIHFKVVPLPLDSREGLGDPEDLQPLLGLHGCLGKL